METNADDKCIEGFDILVKLIQNIIKNPSEDKFRNIKKSNKILQHFTKSYKIKQNSTKSHKI